jgi:hypothetical protein
MATVFDCKFQQRIEAPGFRFTLAGKRRAMIATDNGATDVVG